MTNSGWIKLHRKILENPIAKKPEWAWLWIYLLLKASHEDTEYIFKGEKHICHRGQLLTGRNLIAKETRISSSTIENILNYLESEHQIEQQKTSKNRLITILNYNQYQKPDNKLTANKQQIDSKLTPPIYIQEGKEGKEVKNKPFKPIATGTDEAFKYFCETYEKKVGKKYIASFAKDKAILKDLLKVLSITELQELINSFLDSGDSFIIQSGYTVGAFKSQINKLRTQPARYLTPQQRETVRGMKELEAQWRKEEEDAKTKNI